MGAKFTDGSFVLEPEAKGGGMTAVHNPSANLELMEKHIAAALEVGDTPTRTVLEEQADAIVFPKVQLTDATLEEAVTRSIPSPSGP